MTEQTEPDLTGATPSTPAPTVGRIVHVFPGPRTDLCRNGLGPQDPIAAIVVRVWGAGASSVAAINACAIVDGLGVEWVTSVPHASNTTPDGFRWEWPARV